MHYLHFSLCKVYLYVYFYLQYVKKAHIYIIYRKISPSKVFCHPSTFSIWPTDFTTNFGNIIEVLDTNANYCCILADQLAQFLLLQMWQSQPFCRGPWLISSLPVTTRSWPAAWHLPCLTVSWGKVQSSMTRTYIEFALHTHSQNTKTCLELRQY